MWPTILIRNFRESLITPFAACVPAAESLIRVPAPCQCRIDPAHMAFPRTSLVRGRARCLSEIQTQGLVARPSELAETFQISGGKIFGPTVGVKAQNSSVWVQGRPFKLGTRLASIKCRNTELGKREINQLCATSNVASLIG